MSVLSDLSIHSALQTGDLVIEPLDPNDIQPASVDLRLDHRFTAPREGRLDPLKDNSALYESWEETGPFVVPPRWFFLGATREFVKIPDDIRGRVEGKSSIARLGLVVHVTGGFIDPGFEGPITLEICNLSGNIIVLDPGMKICQIEFTRLTTPAQRPYGSEGLGSKYTANRAGPTVSKYHEDGS